MSGNLSSSEEDYYKVYMNEGENLSVIVDKSSWRSSVYIKYGSIPDTSDYDYREYNYANEQIMAISETKAGYYYLMVHSAYGDHGSYTITINPPPKVTGISPDRGGNAGIVTATISGISFQDGISVKLAKEGQADIEGKKTAVLSAAEISARFNLTGRVTGLWDIIVSLPDNTETVLEKAFTVEAGGKAALWLDISGRNQIRVGREQTYELWCGNAGNIDAQDVVLVSFLPEKLEYIYPLATEERTKSPMKSAELLKNAYSSEEKKGPLIWIVNPIPAETRRGIKLAYKISTPSGVLKTVLKGYMGMVSGYLEYTDRLIEGQNPEIAREEVNHLYHEFMENQIDKPITLEDFAGRFAGFINEKLGVVLDVKSFYDDLVEMSTTAESISELYGIEQEITEYQLEKTIQPVFSWDPNEKFGPTGFGEQAFLIQYTEFQYIIFFENLASATAEAEYIKITDKLDSHLGWTTLSIGETSHPEKDAFEFDANSGTITWTFTDINLPPNVNPPEGEGWVKFSIKHKEGLASGTQIKNKAIIVFDFNPPIDTPEVVNTIDSEAPSSHIEPLAAEQFSPSFEVKWTGSDDEKGSGIKDYTIYVSDNGGPPVSWLRNITETSATFTGENNHTYRFYSIAHDNVGHSEEATKEFETTTCIKVKKDEGSVKDGGSKGRGCFITTVDKYWD